MCGRVGAAGYDTTGAKDVDDISSNASINNKVLMNILVNEFNKRLQTSQAGVEVFTEKTLRDQLGTFLAGHDTTAALLSFV